MNHVIPYLFGAEKRIIIITGHYGSGKTEFAVNLAMMLKSGEMDCPFSQISLVDLDVANPYFRSRERKELLESNGIHVYGSAYDSEITAELPALSATIRTPLETPDCCAILDIGGNDSGARVLRQFRKYYQTEESLLLTVVNQNRPETRTLEGALAHISSIQTELERNVDGLINNTHLLRETTVDTIRNGVRFCEEISTKSGKPVICSTYPRSLIKGEDVEDLSPPPVIPLNLFMRPEWLDR